MLFCWPATSDAFSNPAGLGIKTVAGQCGPLTWGIADGPAGSAKFEAPSGIAISANNSWIAIADDLNNRVRRLASEVVDTLAGQGELGFADGAAGAAKFRRPVAVAISTDGTWVAVADRENSLIRRISVVDGAVSTIAGSGSKGFVDGDAAECKFNTPTGLAISPDDSWIAVADAGNHAIRKVEVATGATQTIVGALPGQGQGEQGFEDGHATGRARLNNPKGVAFSANGTLLAIADSGNHAVRGVRMEEETRNVTTWAGGAAGYVDGLASAAKLREPLSVAFAPDGAAVLIADGGNRRLRALSLSPDAEAQSVWTINGTGGRSSGEFGGFEELAVPSDLAVSSDGQWMVVTLAEHNCVVNISQVPRSPPPSAPSPPSPQLYSAVIVASAPPSVRTSWILSGGVCVLSVLLALGCTS